MGRPTKFQPEFVEQARKLAQLGATDREVADFFGVNESTITRWKQTNAEFCMSLKTGKTAADDRVEQALYRRAIGYSHDAVKIMVAAGEVVHEPFVEHYPPDTTAAIFWLKNRRREVWRDVQDHRHEVRQAYDLSGVSDNDLIELERIFEAARCLEDHSQREGAAAPSGLH